jgi:hypothetical protein
MSDHPPTDQPPPWPTCPRDGFPLVTIGGKQECVAEYLDRCIGGEAIISIAQRGQTYYYVFESGHELPLLCFCCGNPLAIKNLDGSRSEMRGRRLESLFIEEVDEEDGRTLPRLMLVYSSKGLSSEEIVDGVSPQVAAKLRHPPSCLFKPHPPTPAKSPQKKGQRRKKR